MCLYQGKEVEEVCLWPVVQEEGGGPVTRQRGRGGMPVACGPGGSRCACIKAER